jgi:hypothetical protein
MKRFSVIVVASASALLLSAATSHRGPQLNARQLHFRAESARLRAHFDSVDQELRGRAVSSLTDEQRAMRSQLISWLRDYRNAGRFPENDKFADRAMPFFRDSHGTLCAMAYLVDRSGRGDIVDHIASTRNNAFIRELTDDQDLVAWLDASGLTVDEAARIQPQYGPYPVIVSDEKRVSPNYAILSMGLSGVSLGSLGFNVFTPSWISGGVGLTAGVATIIAGAAHLEDPIGNKRVAIANTTVGSLAAIGALRAMFLTRHAHQRAAVETTRNRLLSETSISPDVVMVDNKAQMGLRLRARF